MGTRGQPNFLYIGLFSETFLQIGKTISLTE